MPWYFVCFILKKYQGSNPDPGKYSPTMSSGPPTLSVVCVVHACFCSSDLGPWWKHSAAGVRPSECPSLRSAAGHVESALSGFLLGSLCPCKAGCVPPPVTLFPLTSTVFFGTLHLITSEVLTTTYLVVQNEMVPPESPSLLFSPSLPLSGCLSVF